MKKLRKNFNTILSGLSYQHTSDNLTRQEKSKALSHSTQTNDVKSNIKNNIKSDIKTDVKTNVSTIKRHPKHLN